MHINWLPIITFRPPLRDKDMLRKRHCSMQECISPFIWLSVQLEGRTKPITLQF